MTDKTRIHARVPGGPQDVIVRLWYRTDGRVRPPLAAAAAVGNDRDEWSMPVLRDAPPQQHRERFVSPHNLALIAKQLTRKEVPADPQAQAAEQAEWDKLRAEDKGKGSWDESALREYDEVAREARSSGKTVHLGRFFPISTIKHWELCPSKHKHK